MCCSNSNNNIVNDEKANNELIDFIVEGKLIESDIDYHITYNEINTYIISYTKLHRFFNTKKYFKGAYQSTNELLLISTIENKYAMISLINTSLSCNLLSYKIQVKQIKKDILSISQCLSETLNYFQKMNYFLEGIVTHLSSKHISIFFIFNKTKINYAFEYHVKYITEPIDDNMIYSIIKENNDKKLKSIFTVDIEDKDNAAITKVTYFIFEKNISFNDDTHFMYYISKHNVSSQIEFINDTTSMISRLSSEYTPSTLYINENKAFFILLVSTDNTKTSNSFI